MFEQKAKYAYAALVIGVVSISWSALFVRWTSMPGAASAFYRCLFALCALCASLFSAPPPRKQRNRSEIYLATLGGVFFAGDVALYNCAVIETSAGVATLLSNSAPLIVGVLTWALTRRRPSAPFWSGLALAFCGSLVIFRGDKYHLAAGVTGDLMAVAASSCFAIYLLITERLRRDLDTKTLLAYSLAGSTLALAIYNFATGTSLRIPSISSLAALLGMALISQLLGYFALTYALGHLPATATSVSLLAIAPLTALLAFLFLHERLFAEQCAGGLLVLIGVAITNLRTRLPEIAFESDPS